MVPGDCAAHESIGEKTLEATWDEKGAKMRDTPTVDRRNKAKEYWDTHAIDEEGEETDVEVKRPLSAVLSLRLDPRHLDKLKSLARAQDIGVTTMARKLLQQAVDNADKKTAPRPLGDETFQTAMESVLKEAKVPPGDEEATYCMLSKETIEHIEHTARVLLEALQETSTTVTAKRE